MGPDWVTATLGEVCATITDGAHFSPKEDPLGLPMASVKDLTRHGIDLRHCKRISATDFEVLKAQGCMPAIGDVLIAKDGNSALDTVCVHRRPEEVVLLSSVAILRPGKRIDSDFLMYYLDAPQTRALLKAGFRSGSAIPRVVLRDFRRAPVTVPPVSEQRAIARVLRTLDDKIELNQRMNATLELIARGIFRSWFVDFEPARARAEGRQPAGMDAEAAALFSGSFETLQNGRIPSGWRCVPLDEVADFRNGLAMQRFPPQGAESLPVVKIAELNRGNTNGADRASANLGPSYVVDDGDVLFSWSGSLMARIWCGGRGALNQHLFKVTSTGFPRWFYYFWLLEHLPDFQLIAAGKATTMGHIQRHHLHEALVAVPPQPLLDYGSRVIEPLLSRIVLGSAESGTLQSLRDALLPELLNGVLRATGWPGEPQDA